MGSLIYYGALFLAKVLDNALSTTKTILIQRSRWLLAGIAVVLSDFIYFWLTKRIVSGDNNWAILIVSLAGGVGCALACLFSEKLSKDRTYVNVIMSDNLRAMRNFRDFLATHHITNEITSWGFPIGLPHCSREHGTTCRGCLPAPCQCH